MNVIEGDLLDIHRGILAHQVNCMGVMGAGLALQIADKWPKVRAAYMAQFKLGWDLGRVQLVNVGSELWVANCASQYYIARRGTLAPTDYDAVAACFKTLRGQAQHDGTIVYLPWNYGCGLAGGDWTKVSQILEQELPDAVIVKKLT